MEDPTLEILYIEKNNKLVNKNKDKMAENFYEL
jgi:hypothetical protein